MPNVRVTIDGTEVSVPAGSTILDAAKLSGADIPTLCAHDALEPIGACRMCLVEVEKQRILQPACTFPVSDGMVVHTETERVGDAHRFVLQLLFSERNHFCMFCQMSGSCELQDLGYRYGIDHWQYDRAFPKLQVDASRQYFVMDHNRCVLCRRCVRACNELVGNGTLGIKNRGAQSMIIADMDVPFGDSTCVSCGTCMQVCPTGALMDRASAFMGATDEITRVKSRCVACSVGCGAELIVRQNRVIRVEGDWADEASHGLLCQIGRFELLHEKRQRVRKPMVKGANGWQESTMDAALQDVAEALKAAGDDAATLVSGFATTEAGKAVMCALPGRKSLMTTNGAIDPSDSLACLDEADLFIVVNTDLTVDYQVAGFALKRGVLNRGAKVILLDDEENGLDGWAMKKWSPRQAANAVAIARDAEVPAIVYGPAGADVAHALARQLSSAKTVGFAPQGNTQGLAQAGISSGFEADGSSAYYVVAGETSRVDSAVWDALKKADFVAVQASFLQPWDQVADVILPSPTWHEKSGTTMNAQGEVGHVGAAITSKLHSEVEVIEKLGELL